jgi:hypothetical protein
MGYRYTYDPATGQFAHASGIMVLTPGGRISKYFYGVEYAPRDLRLGLVEASQNRIGNPVDQILLFCYHYDPATGKYGAIAMNMVRFAAAALSTTTRTTPSSPSTHAFTPRTFTCFSPSAVAISPSIPGRLGTRIFSSFARGIRCSSRAPSQPAVASTASSLRGRADDSTLRDVRTIRQPSGAAAAGFRRSR